MSDNDNDNDISNQHPRSLLTVDIGSINTRVSLFDVVEGRYRYLASGRAGSTANAPMFDISEGLRQAMVQLQRVSSRPLMGANGQLIIPSTENGAGADNLAVSISFGEPLKTVVAGLLDRVSLASALNLAKSTYTNVVETISIGSQGTNESRIDKILRIRPEVIIISGGTNEGASSSVLKLVNTLGMALYLMPKEARPEVLFAGNPELQAHVQAFFKQIAPIHVAPNIRPSLAVEQLGPAQSILTDIFQRVNMDKTTGISELTSWASGNMLPAAAGLGRVIRFFSKMVQNTSKRGVLGIDIGASTTTVAAGFNGDLRLRVFNNLGMGGGLTGVMENIHVEDILRWLPLDIPKGYVINYIQNKILHPSIIPATEEDMAVEQAIAREVIRYSIKEAEASFPKDAPRLSTETIPLFAPILVGGGVLSLAPSPVDSLLMILDAVQPNGIQQIILDKNNIAPTLGAAAEVNPILVSQLLLDPVAFLNLGTIIAPVGKVRHDQPVVRIRIAYDSGQENTVTVRKGSIAKIPLAVGRKATLYIDPLHRTNVGEGPGKSVLVHVVGGPFGVVVDARGRPVELPSSDEKRRDELFKWHDALQF